MQFLANENFPRPSILFLRESGFKVLSIAEQNPGVSDIEVVETAKTDHLTILTFDKDYGEIIFRHGGSSPPSVIYFRFKGLDPGFAGRILKDLIQVKKIVFENTFTVIEEANIRQRRY